MYGGVRFSSITLILVATDDGSCDDHMTYLLDLIFNAMVMVIGLQELDSPTHIERLKQRFKVRLFSGRPESFRTYILLS